MRIAPDQCKRVYLDWMREIRPWCVSRQLWWGHRIPVWYCDACEETYVAEEPPEHCGACGGELRQEEDVLDTWFSSAIWPFATLGWPDDTPELRAFYPTSFLTTAREILFLWVARMIMTGLEFAGDIPFRDVYVHSVIQAPDGRRMSKSLGTGIDPLEEIDDHGADALRFGLLAMSSTQDVRYSAAKVQQGRDLANKLWNAQLVDPRINAPAEARGGAAGGPRSRTAGSSRGCSGRSPRSPRSSRPTTSPTPRRRPTRFFWSELCDWYLEIVKPRLYDGEEEVSATLLGVLELVLALLHPMMPFVTEEIWSYHPARARPPGRASRFRRPTSRWSTRRAEADVEAAIELTRRLRAWRDLVGVPVASVLLGPGRRRRAARVRRPPLALRLRRGRGGAGRGGRPGQVLASPRSTPRRSPADRGAAREAPRRGQARRAQARQRGLRRQGARRGRRGGARQARALPRRARGARVDPEAYLDSLEPIGWKLGLERMLG